MGAGVAGQCARKRCLVPVEVWIPIVAAEAEQVERTRRKTWSWARSRFFVPYRVWSYLFRAIDQFGQVIDVFLSPRRNREAARRFFARAMDRTRVSPVEVTTDRYRVYPRILDELLPAA